MKHRIFGLVMFILLPCRAYAESVVPIHQLRVAPSSQWKTIQVAESGDRKLAVIQHGDEQIFLMSSPTLTPLSEYFSPSSRIVEPSKTTLIGKLNWDLLTAQYSNKNRLFSVTGLTTNVRGTQYVVFSRSPTKDRSQANAIELLSTAELVLKSSLTSAAYFGKKFYFGWGAADPSDPGSMHNEVKYDVLHTHDIFTAAVGGLYSGQKLLGYRDATASAIRNTWKTIRNSMGSDDMYVQYSSGHGSETGLGVGLSYHEMRDMALGLPGHEVIILIMACHSGALVDAFNQKRTLWQNWQQQGRSLFVFASSEASENSSTGPGRDPDESGPTGSAGSAFGHALWKALIGYADGFVDGVKDGFLSIEEIRDYTRYRTRQVGGHTPVETGTYAPGLVMNQVPSKQFLASLEGSSEGLSEDQIEEKIRLLNEELSVRRTATSRPSTAW